MRLALMKKTEVIVLLFSGETEVASVETDGNNFSNKINKETNMNVYLILHNGFEKLTPEQMGAWGKWFESIADIQVEKGGFHQSGLEISATGTR